MSKYATTDLAPKRLADTARALQREGSITAASLAACIGASASSMTSTLRGMRDRGLAESTGDGDTATWRWVGGEVLVPYRDLTPAQRSILLALRAQGPSVGEALESATCTPYRVVLDHLQTLEGFGWVTRTKRAPEPGVRGRAKIEGRLSTAGCEALAVVVPSTRSA